MPLLHSGRMQYTYPPAPRERRLFPGDRVVDETGRIGIVESVELGEDTRGPYSATRLQQFRHRHDVVFVRYEDGSLEPEAVTELTRLPPEERNPMEPYYRVNRPQRRRGVRVRKHNREVN